MSDTEEEQIHIEQFLPLIEGLEIYKFERQKPPEPDFYALTNFGLIGIEHTRLFKKIDSNGVDPVLHQKEADLLLKEATERFNNISDFKVHVTVSFRSDYGVGRLIKNPVWLNKSSRIELAKTLVEFVLNNVPKDQSFIDCGNPHIWTGDYFLPEVVESVNIGHYSQLSRSTFGSSSFHFSPSIEKGSRIHGLIRKKNFKLEKYKIEYDQTWLVLVASPFDLNSDFNFERNDFPTIDSEFSKVFIYRHGDMKYHELSKTAE
jgi:hypothetical protein